MSNVERNNSCDLISLFFSLFVRMESAAHNNVVSYFSSEKDVLESQPCDLREDDTESLDTDLHVIEDCLDDEHIKNHYKDIRKFGEGGYGRVYSAKHKIDKKSYALLFVVINRKTFDKREVEILSSLDHKNIIRYYTSWTIKFRKSIIYTTLRSEEDASDNIIFENENSRSCNNNVTYGKESVKSSNKHKSDEEEIIDSCLVIQTELCGTRINLRTMIDADIYLPWRIANAAISFWM